MTKIQTARTINHVKISNRKSNFGKDEESLLTDSDKPINFNPIEIILRMCPCKTLQLNLKNLLFEKSYKKMEYYFDIYTYLKKIQEIDIIKYLLLYKNQVNLFNFLSSPFISMSYSDSYEIYQNGQKNRDITGDTRVSLETLQEMFISYNKLKCKNDNLNNKLLNLFDYEIENILID